MRREVKGRQQRLGKDGDVLWGGEIRKRKGKSLMRGGRVKYGRGSRMGAIKLWGGEDLKVWDGQELTIGRRGKEWEGKVIGKGGE